MAVAVSEADGCALPPLWVNRVYGCGSSGSGRSCRELLESWRVHPHLIGVLESHGISELFPCQEKVIPLLLSGDSLDRYSVGSSDFVVTAPTGQGKTLCYLLPIVNGIVHCNRVGLSALILAPTRELVQQTYDFCSWFVSSDPSTYGLRGGELLRVHSCHGNTPFITDHLLLLDHPPQIVVFTPGRFVEHFAHRAAAPDRRVDFSTLRWIVIDEVDLLLSQSFYNWTSAVLQIGRDSQRTAAGCADYCLLPRFPQKILVSATIPSKSAEIDLLQLHRPLLFQGASGLYSLPSTLEQKVIVTTRSQKSFVLVTLLSSILGGVGAVEKTIVFCSSKKTAHSTARLLELFFQETGSSVSILELSARYSQKQRGDILQRFQSASTACLVCSDVGSRGMNFFNTRNIVNFDFPKSVTTYIHRIGRTARANESGTSYMLLCGQDVSKLSDFASELKVPLDDLEHVSIGDLFDSRDESKFREALDRSNSLVERCLELEGAGTISHDSALPPNWRALFSEPSSGSVP